MSPSLPPIITGAIQALTGAGTSQTLLLTPDPTLRNDLKPNTVLSGKVQSNLGDGKYLVSFIGKDYVVESTSLLKADEIIHGRVIGVGDKIELQRIYQEKASADKQSIKQQNWQLLYESGKSGFRMAEVLQNYRVTLSADEQLSLLNFLKGSGEAEAVALTSVVLNKVGLKVSDSSLKILYPILSSSLNQKFTLQEITAHIDFETSSGAVTDSKTISELSAFIASVVSEFPEVFQKSKINSENIKEELLAAENDFSNTDNDLNTNNGESSQDKNMYDFDARRVLLNSQSDGTVSHRIAVIPFIINEKLIEVDVAFFSQRHHHASDNSIVYKKIVLSLNLDMLGKIDVEIALANRNARVKINSDKNIITEEMVKYMPQLKADLEVQKIKIDELSYETTVSNDLGNVINSVVNHYVTQDSLSRIY